MDLHVFAIESGPRAPLVFGLVVRTGAQPSLYSSEGIFVSGERDQRGEEVWVIEHPDVCHDEEKHVKKINQDGN